jgi:phosphomannomutase / phosphoglucomutase
MAQGRDIAAGIFRAYDIRGIVGQGMDATSVRNIGQAIGSEVLDLGEDTLLVARDARLSSPALVTALIDGILDAGCNALDLGVVPTHCCISPRTPCRTAAASC